VIYESNYYHDQMAIPKCQWWM